MTTTTEIRPTTHRRAHSRTPSSNESTTNSASSSPLSASQTLVTPSTTPSPSVDPHALSVVDNADDSLRAFLVEVDEWLGRIGQQVAALERRHRKNLSMEDTWKPEWSKRRRGDSESKGSRVPKQANDSAILEQGLRGEKDGIGK